MGLVQITAEQNLIEIATVKDWVERYYSTGVGVGVEPVRCELEHSVRTADGHQNETSKKAGQD